MKKDKKCRQYCDCCYGAAEKAGRLVRKTDVYEYPICELCESRIKKGLICYTPSNGTEGDMFMQQCENCRHYKETDDGGSCKLKILDQIWEGAFADSDSIVRWFKPDVLSLRGKDGEIERPATCLKFSSL